MTKKEGGGKGKSQAANNCVLGSKPTFFTIWPHTTCYSNHLTLLILLTKLVGHWLGRFILSAIIAGIIRWGLKKKL
jgi:hypothetical protein